MTDSVPLQMIPSKTRRPISFVNTTRTGFQHVLSDRNFEDTGNALQASDIRFKWTSRNNRKGRHALIIKPSDAESSAYEVPPYTDTLSQVCKGIWLMAVYYPIWDISWLVAYILAWGSLVWLLDAFFIYMPFLDTRANQPGLILYGGGISAFVATTLFEIGSALLLIEAFNADQSGCFGWAVDRVLAEDDEGGKTIRARPDENACNHHHSDKSSLVGSSPESYSRSWTWWPTGEQFRRHYVHDIGFMAAAAELAGSTLFWIMGFAALPGIYDHLTPATMVWAYWTSQIIGGLFYVLAGAFMMIETQKHWWLPDARSLGWHIGLWNLIGGVGFTLSPVLGLDVADSWATYQVACSNFWGCWAFLIASLLQWYESLNKHPVERSCHALPPRQPQPYIDRTASMTYADKAAIYAQHAITTAHQDIRVLMLLPGHYSDEIECGLSVHSLKSKEEHNQGYDALSYTWGGYCENKHISIHNCSFKVTDNPYRALRQLRSCKTQRTLWIDALCINQDDLQERGEQVTIMALIYKSADNVLVWLGDSTDTEDTEKHDWTVSCQAKLDRATSETTPSWWQRAWTVQEYVLSKRQPQLCFGNCIHSVAEYFDYRSKNHQVMQSMPFGNLTSALSLNEDIRSAMAGGEPKPTMVTLLQDLSKYAATDSRDYIYCLLGLMKEQEASLLKPDYTIQPSIVFARATYASIAGSGSLEIMKRAGWENWTKPTLPSWAIDRTPEERTLRTTWGYPRHWPPEARPLWPGEPLSSQVHVSLDSTSTRLSLEAGVLGPVERLIFKRHDGIDHCCEPIHDLLQFDDRWQHLIAQHHTWEARDSWRHNIVQAGGTLFRDWHLSVKLSKSDDFWNSESGVLHDHGFVLFEAQGLLCVAVGAIDVGDSDIVVLPHGCPYPMLVRPQQETYKFMCFIHVHGIMEGELREQKHDHIVHSAILILT
ncbi:hypothetical protein AMS68_000539 [Peltaster fructicola]|uniref:Heterokaryon incompatibility domain-containing protein n=1 Tax=Peltaster fructicola TaxID=286661 RepID=A0A6H0XJX5_9PEZI|nr:hypothetical protein AMS68_000539 [Peltaster fructicola]